MANDNAGQITIYEQIPTDLKKAIEDVLFNRINEATENLIEISKDIPEILKEKKIQINGEKTIRKSRICVGKWHQRVY